MRLIMYSQWLFIFQCMFKKKKQWTASTFPFKNLLYYASVVVNAIITNWSVKSLMLLLFKFTGSFLNIILTTKAASSDLQLHRMQVEVEHHYYRKQEIQMFSKCCLWIYYAFYSVSQSFFNHWKQKNPNICFLSARPITTSYISLFT